MERLAAAWLWIGDSFKRRPVAVVGFILGAVIFAAGLSYILVTETRNADNIQKVQDVICNQTGPFTPQVQRNCRHLLDKLLKNPTPQQAQRLKQIIKESQ